MMLPAVIALMLLAAPSIIAEQQLGLAVQGQEFQGKIVATRLNLLAPQKRAEQTSGCFCSCRG
jgi:hypothetical protein